MCQWFPLVVNISEGMFVSASKLASLFYSFNTPVIRPGSRGASQQTDTGHYEMLVLIQTRKARSYQKYRSCWRRVPSKRWSWAIFKANPHYIICCPTTPVPSAGVTCPLSGNLQISARCGPACGMPPTANHRLKTASRLQCADPVLPSPRSS